MALGFERSDVKKLQSAGGFVPEALAATQTDIMPDGFPSGGMTKVFEPCAASRHASSVGKLPTWIGAGGPPKPPQMISQKIVISCLLRRPHMTRVLEKH